MDKRRTRTTRRPSQQSFGGDERGWNGGEEFRTRDEENGDAGSGEAIGDGRIHEHVQVAGVMRILCVAIQQQ